MTRKVSDGAERGGKCRRRRMGEMGGSGEFRLTECRGELCRMESTFQLSGPTKTATLVDPARLGKHQRGQF